MFVGPAAVKHCGMLASHAAVFTEVANSNRVVLGSRELNPLCESLLKEGHASKGFYIKAKSCDWGPMAGMVLVDPRFSKESNLEKQARYVADALKKGAGKANVFISSLRLMELTNLGLITQEKSGGIAATEINIKASSKKGASADFIVRRVGNQEPIWQLFEVTTGGEKPVEGLTNKLVPAAGPQPSGARAVVAGDYDLFCVWPRHRNQRALPTGPRVVTSGKVGTAYIKAVKTAKGGRGDEDPDMGNVSFYATRIIKQLNEGIVAKAGYKGGNMIHHNDESGNPFTPGEDYPLLFFVPGLEPRAVCNAHELAAIYDECEQLGYVVERNPGFSVARHTAPRMTTLQRLQQQLD